MKFLTTKGIASSIEDIIKNAKEYVFIISPYVKIDESYIERLFEAENNGVNLTLIFGKEDMNDFEKDKFKKFNNLEIRFLENLHAKCYLNENTALITSMNLYGYSEKNNREMGIEINKSENSDIYGEIKKEADSIKNNAESYTISNKNSQKNNSSNIQYNKYDNKYGYCIRCRDKITFDTERPLCDYHFGIWSKFGDPFYRESYCHKCGRNLWDEEICYAHPLCDDCYYNNSF